MSPKELSLLMSQGKREGRERTFIYVLFWQLSCHSRKKKKKKIYIYIYI